MPKLGPYSQEINRLNLDGRTHEGRIFEVTRRELIEYLGGEDKLTRLQRILVERAARLQLRLSLLDERLLSGKFTEYDEKTYLAWSNSLVRCLRDLAAPVSTKPEQDNPLQRLYRHLADRGVPAE